MDIQTIVLTVVIPFIIGFLRKMGLPTKWAPITAYGVALILVGIATAFGIDMSVATIADAILKGLGMAGVAVLGYDAIAKAITPSK